jgi:hypothetical protein
MLKFRVIGAALMVIAAVGVSEPVRASTPSSGITFEAYHAPDGMPNAHSAGEMSIGTVKETTDALVQMRFTTARITWDDTVDPPIASWSNVTPATNHATYDPILWIDRVTGRTFVTLLLPGTAITSFTDDGGKSWTPTEPPVTVVGFDHESIGGGPYSAPRPGQAYPDATYYCLGVTVATCSRSDDGGLTWGAPIATGVPSVGGDLVGVHVDDPLGDCVPVHGHVVVGPDGSVYVPRHQCGSTQGMVVSRDEGTTWNNLIVPGTVARTDVTAAPPAIAFDAAGRMYFAASSGGRPVIATSTDGGESWSAPADVGTDFAIRNTEFAAVVAGAADRAAFAFLGTPSDGSDQSAAFTGVWHLYVSYTFDGGATWETVDATPNDPFQRGCIGLNGGNPGTPANDLVLPDQFPGGRPDKRFLDVACRNLLDFQDVTVDGQGRVLVSYADGCTSAVCVSPNGTPDDSRDSLATIFRQASGPRLFAAFDPVE